MAADNVAILIPNLRFILDNVVNVGYLGGPVRLRLPVSVGVATDVGLLKPPLLEAAAETPGVLRMPAPQITVGTTLVPLRRRTNWPCGSDPANCLARSCPAGCISSVDRALA